MEELKTNVIDANTMQQIKKELLAKLSFDFRTSINGIIGITELVLDTDLTVEQREYLSIVKESAEQLMSMFYNSYGLYRTESDKYESFQIIDNG